MNKQEPEQTQENLGKLLERHWLHCQHVESERAQFMQVYAAIIAGIVVGCSYLISIGKDLNEYLVLYTLLFLIVLTFVGFFLTLRWVYTFECHRVRVNEIASILWLSCNVAVPLDPTMDIPSMHIMPGCLRKVDGIFRTRYWFPLFYLFVLIGILALINWPLKDYFPTSWFFKLECLDLVVLAFAIFITYRGFNSIRKLGIEKRVVLAGCNGEWAQKRYLPFLIEKAKRGDITLWATDIQPEIKLNSPRSRSLFKTAKSKGKACYLDMTKSVESCEIPWNVDYVFIVTPDRCHCEVAEFWLSRLSTTGKIFIEKPLDASIKAAEQLEAKILNNNVVYGFDHYLATLRPFLRCVRQYLAKIDDIKSLEINILEHNKIQQHQAQTLQEGMIFDLFPHILAVSAAVVEKKLAPTEAILQKAEFVDGARAKYRGWHFSTETCARIEFLVGNKRVTVTGRVGKGIGEEPDKRMTIYGADGRKVEIKFRTYLKTVGFSVKHGETTRDVESKHVESFLEAVLAGSRIDSVPGVLSFGAAFAILEWLSRNRNKITMRRRNYAVGTPACQ